MHDHGLMAACVCGGMVVVVCGVYAWVMGVGCMGVWVRVYGCMGVWV